ncbi:MAG: fibronectin type III domain-containing protein, partial [Bacteroidota bacterium]|nr:fibronectin type III domain-containing protein [Bacteroidota bacterium]
DIDKTKGGGNDGDADSKTGTTGNGSNASENKNNPCPAYGFKFNNTPSYNCVALAWWSLSTKVNSVDAQGNFKQSNQAEAKYFTIEFRRQGDIHWTADRRDNTGRNVHTLSSLDACTQYEVRLIADCGNNTSSSTSNIVRFKTACNAPGKLSVENISNHSAKVSSQRLTASITHPCSSSASTQIRIVEYKSNTGDWEDIICNSGSPCFLNGLNPGTVYRVRARYKYGDNLYSNYTNEVSFKTTGF